MDICFEMLPCTKPVPNNEWVWILQERLEDAHTFVWVFTGKRQKKYHDANISYEHLSQGDKGYVYFPVKQIGCSSKFTSYWRGQFEILGKLSDIKVNCGHSSSPQVIHVYRI